MCMCKHMRIAVCIPKLCRGSRCGHTGGLAGVRGGQRGQAGLSGADSNQPEMFCSPLRSTQAVVAAAVVAPLTVDVVVVLVTETVPVANVRAMIAGAGMTLTVSSPARAEAPGLAATVSQSERVVVAGSATTETAWPSERVAVPDEAAAVDLIVRGHSVATAAREDAVPGAVFPAAARWATVNGGAGGLETAGEMR